MLLCVGILIPLKYTSGQFSALFVFVFRFVLVYFNFPSFKPVLGQKDDLENFEMLYLGAWPSL